MQIRTDAALKYPIHILKVAINLQTKVIKKKLRNAHKR